MACKMCKSEKHSTEHHARQATLGRLKSKKWKKSMRSKHKTKGLKQYWKKNYKEMCKKRKLQVTPEWRKKNGKRLKKQWADEKWHAKMCEIRKTQSKGNQARSPNGSWYRTKYNGVNGNFWMRSSWEVAFANWLDHFGIRWEYEPRVFHVGNGQYYLPDFYLPDQNEYVELKGWMTKKSEKKMQKFKEMYPELNLYIFFGKHLANILPFRKVA